MMRTTNRHTVAAAKKFVTDPCRDELTPGAIDRLRAIYRPPSLQGDLPTMRSRAVSGFVRQSPPRVFVTHLVRADPPAGSEDSERVGYRIARSRRRNRKRTYVL